MATRSNKSQSSSVGVATSTERATRSKAQKSSTIAAHIESDVVQKTKAGKKTTVSKTIVENADIEAKKPQVTSPYFKVEELHDLPKPSKHAKQKRKPVQVAYEMEPSSVVKAEESSSRVQSSVGNNNEKKSKWEPANWATVIDNIREMRKGKDAPVDDMGCDIWMDKDDAPEVLRYHSLISLMLSSQTKDQVNHAAMVKLRDHGLTVDNILKIDDKTLGELIYPVSFWKTKVQHIKRTTLILKDEYASDIPDTVEKLCSLPGVGPKMAHICMNVAWGKNTGIGVDTHVHRISNRLGWVRAPTKTPEHTRKELEAWLPMDLWQEVNHMLVGFGQQTCKPIGPKCDTCLNQSICPIGQKTVKLKKK